MYLLSRTMVVPIIEVAFAMTSDAAMAASNVPVASAGSGMS